MEKIYSFIRSITPDGFDVYRFLQFLGIFLLGGLAIGAIARLIFGKRSNLNRSVSAAIAILCIYVVNVVIYSCGAKLQILLSPLPFVNIEGDHLVLFQILSADYKAICAQVLDMVILAFLANLLDSWLPKGKKVLGWFFFRILSVILAICLQYIVDLLLGIILPQGFYDIAPTVLIGVLIASLLLGALKLLVGGALGCIDPLLGLFYTFFFSNVIGKQLSKAILTTGILTGLVCLMDHLGITAIYIASAALAAYIPLLIIVLILWYVISHFL